MWDELGSSISLSPCELQIAPAEGPDVSERMVIITGPPEAQFKVSAQGHLSPAGPGHRTVCQGLGRAFRQSAATSEACSRLLFLEASCCFSPHRLALSSHTRVVPLLQPSFPSLPGKVDCQARSWGSSCSGTDPSALVLSVGVSDSFSPACPSGGGGIHMGCKGTK